MHGDDGVCQEDTELGLGDFADRAERPRFNICLEILQRSSSLRSVSRLPLPKFFWGSILDECAAFGYGNPGIHCIIEKGDMNLWIR